MLRLENTLEKYPSLPMWLHALSLRDQELFEHSQEVAELAASVSEEMGLSPQEKEEVILVGLLHDMGKLAIPDRILQKEGSLSPEELALIREHPTIGANMVAENPSLEAVADAIRAEHEWWDGNGYPNQLSGEGIPLSSRVVAVCDAYSAIRRKRSYDGKHSHEDAIIKLLGGRDTQFDPNVLKAFLVVENRAHSA
jgi:putative nucleotidyltransferase with HDIG domain